MIENPYTRQRPWASNEERLVTQALSAAVIPGDVLRQSVSPPIPRVMAFPPRFGYEQRAIGIADIVNLDVLYPGGRVDYSQSRSGYSGSSFPALGVM